MYKVNLALIILLFFFSCSQIQKRNNIPIHWKYLTEKSMPDIHVYRGENKEIPIRAWYVKINLKSEELKIKIIKSKEKNKKESPLKMMVENQSLVLINGGFLLYQRECNLVRRVAWGYRLYPHRVIPLAC